MARRAHFLQRALADGAESVRLCINGPDRCLADTIELAVDSGSRRRGLLGRQGLPEGRAVIIAPSNAVHTFGMQFAIDVIFAARDGQVLSIRADMPRSRATFSLRAFAAVEMAAGTTARLALQRGDRLVLISRGMSTGDDVPPGRPLPGA